MIRLENVEKVYPPSRGAREALTALLGVSLYVPRGAYVAIVGASGSGKSTLMHILGCLDAPSAGSYHLDGMLVSRMDARALCAVRREKIGFVFQGYQLLRRMTALENVALPLLLRGVPERERAARARDALDRVGLANRADSRPDELSGGQQQRVAIARALCYRPPLLLCDEPTGALDPQSRDTVLALMDALHRDGHTVLLITHDESVAARAKARYRVHDGRVGREE